MRFACKFERWVGAAPAGAIALGADAAPTWAVPGPVDRAVNQRAFAGAAAPVTTLWVGVRAPAGAGTLTVDVYMREELTESWLLLGAALTVTPGTLSKIALPAIFGASEAIDLALVVADPGGLPNGQYVIVATASA